MSIDQQPEQPEALWPAPMAHEPIRATVTVPGSKSMTNRALILAAAAAGPSILHGPLDSRDTQLMGSALRALSLDVQTSGDHWTVQPGPMHGPATIDCGLAGTVMRFVPPLATLAHGTVTFDGDARARQRPMEQLIQALRTLGARIYSSNNKLPFTIDGTGELRGGAVQIDASASSQFLSGLLLCAARFTEGIQVSHIGAATLPSRPHIAMTVQMLRQAGVVVDEDAADQRAAAWRVAPGMIQPRDWHIEPDLSTAAPFLAAAMATGGSVTIPGWPTQTTQPGDALRDLLTAMGGTVALDPQGLTVTGPDKLIGLDADLHAVGELTPVLAALCALARTPSRLRGVAHLRGHETDRLAALAKELSKLGADIREMPEGLEIRPRPLRGGVFASYHDHRMAQAGAVLGLVTPGISVEDIAATTKTMPEFAQTWHAMVTGRMSGESA